MINAKYLGQCDKLRSQGFEVEWQVMMENKIPLTCPGDFIHSCDRANLAEFLELDQYDYGDPDHKDSPSIKPFIVLEEFMRDDPDSGLYRSRWGDKLCMFIQVSGFEFIFVQSD